MGSDFDQCYERASEAVVKARAAGRTAVLVQLCGAVRDWPNADPRWAAVDPASWHHYVVRIDGELWDFAPRQFDPKAPVPSPVEEESWREVYEEVWIDRLDSF